jgi:hypothetical protein
VRTFQWFCLVFMLILVQTTNVLGWPGLYWFSGIKNTLPANQTTVSSYEALDQVIKWFANPANFPNMKQIVVAGHSAGAQMCQRYAVIGKPLGLSGASFIELQ